MLKFSILDRLIIQTDSILRRNSDVQNYPTLINNDIQLTESETADAIKMLRVNHSGEICAQALYQGQALFARSNQQYKSLLEAAKEENDHLNWCKRRLLELDGRTSFLNPIWYCGSYTIGLIASLCGDKISLGFLAETEHQVTEHLERHIEKLSKNDTQTAAIFNQMRDDELKHASTAIDSGAIKLPKVIRISMNLCSKILTNVAKII